MRHKLPLLRSAMVTGLLLAFASVSWAQTETFTATASLKTAAGATMTAPVTVVVTRHTSDQERTSVMDALKKSGTSGVVQSLKGMADAGYIEIGDRRTPIKYAYVRPTDGGRLITVVAPTPILHVGAGVPDAQPKAGFDLALAALDVKTAGAGSGELAPAATVKVNDSGALQTQDYGAETIRLTNVQVKK